MALIYILHIGDKPTEVVTHADYRALEEEKCAWYECAERLKAKVVQLEEELKALRVGVGELVEASDHLVFVETKVSTDEELDMASDRFHAALRSMK